jgi:hypothetical protein
LAIGAACVFVFLHANKIELPGIQFDEIIFVDAAEGNTDTPLNYFRLGPVPLFIFPYIGAFKSSNLRAGFPFLRRFGFDHASPDHSRRCCNAPHLYHAVRGRFGSIWAAALFGWQLIRLSQVDWIMGRWC